MWDKRDTAIAVNRYTAYTSFLQMFTSRKMAWPVRKDWLLISMLDIIYDSHG